jgi:hypothetical protein
LRGKEEERGKGKGGENGEPRWKGRKRKAFLTDEKNFPKSTKGSPPE